MPAAPGSERQHPAHLGAGVVGAADARHRRRRQAGIPPSTLLPAWRKQCPDIRWDDMAIATFDSMIATFWGPHEAALAVLHFGSLNSEHCCERIDSSLYEIGQRCRPISAV